MKEITTQYRCSCCDEIKKPTNYVFKRWNQRVKPGNSPIVAICRKCNMAMRKKGYTGVKQFLGV